MEEVALRIFKAYGVTNPVLQKPESGYRNTSYMTVLPNDKPVNIILYKNETGIKDRIKRANLVADHLASQGFPCRSTFDKRIIKISTPQNVRYACIYTYLSGTTIPWEAYTKHHIKVLGMTMAHMHQAMESADSVIEIPSVENEYEGHIKNMHAYFSQLGVQNAMHTKLKVALRSSWHDFELLLRALHTLPGRQILHMDFVRGNLLFSSGSAGKFSDGPVTLTGVIDFEKVSTGHVIFDIARTLSFLLVDCKYKSSEKISKYFLQSGYAKRGGTKIPNITYGTKIDVLHELTTLFLVYDFYKFLKHNPYESLEHNEHYVRTRDILLARKVLQTI